MKAKDIMTNEIVYCTADSPIQEVAMLMDECDCGLIPVVESEETHRPVGVVTDRDIVCRLIAQGKNPLKETAQACMSRHVTTVLLEASLDECIKKMEFEQIRRLLVVDHSKALCGVISQSDIAFNVTEKNVSELLKKVSRPNKRTKAGQTKREIRGVGANLFLV